MSADNDPKKSQPERDQTDESLRLERKKTDQEAAARRSRVEQSADDVVERARVHADALLISARGKVDDQIGTGETSAIRRNMLALERELEDRVLHTERAAADETLRSEREAQVAALNALLPLEREATDRLLFTERVRSDLVLANRDDFMGMVSHDLRSLLSGIVANASVLAEQASDSDEGRRTVAGTERIQRYGARMNRLIGDLVDVVSIDAGKLSLQPLHNDARALLSEAVDAFAQSASEKGVALDSMSEGPLQATFDHQRLLQVLANLITNALKFTPRGGRISIRGERVNGSLHFSVTDTGAGIPPTMLEAVFERFWQVGKNDQRGLGLGLYISKCIVNAHGGKIWAESTMGAGSTFRFTVPAAG